MTADEKTQLDGVWAEVRAVSAKVDILVERDARDLKVIEDHEVRIRSVEKWKMSVPTSALLAIATVVGAVLSRVL